MGGPPWSTPAPPRRSPLRRALSLLVVAVLAIVAVEACASDDVASPIDTVDTVDTVERRSQAPGAADPDAGRGPVDTSPRVTVPATACAPPDATGSPVGITVWHSLGGDQAPDTFDALIAEFVAAHPHVVVDVVRVDGYSGALQRLREIDPTARPDLFMASANDVRLLADSGVFLPPSTCTGTDPAVLDDLLPVVRATYTVGDTLWAYPFNVSSPILLFDRALFDAAGIDPDDPPGTPDELRDAATTVVGSGHATGGLVLSSASMSWLIEQWAVRLDLALLEPDNGRSGPVEHVSIATEPAVAAYEWVREMHVDGLIRWVGRNQSGLDDLFQLIDVTDRAAMTLHTSAALGDIAWLLYESDQPDLEGSELGVGPLPGPGTPGASGSAGTLVGGGALWLVDSGDAARAGTGALLAEFLMAPPEQGRFAAATGYVPATRSAARSPVVSERWSTLPQLEVAYRQLEAQGASPVEVGMQVGPRTQIQRLLERAAIEVVEADRDAREALEAVEREALELLTRYDADLGS